jgi:hypothetical protein
MDIIIRRITCALFTYIINYYLCYFQLMILKPCPLTIGIILKPPPEVVVVYYLEKQHIICCIGVKDPLSNQPPKLLDRVWAVLCRRHYPPRTEASYVNWI